ncbi:DNA (cytosine-5-)-methyltransferase (TIGR00675) [uncultured Mediterranean phage uvMED]|nr:DNA (cytosine-5-)-methyltransferase (TIGR00675) [uncultured Mediterranean phage uvMED]
MKLKILDLFSGIGGFSLGLEATGHFETAAFCEIEPYCKQVLKKHWPTVPIFDDIRQLKGTDIGTIDIITGGYPCQPFSVAGKQKAEQDPRHLWPEYFRLIQELRPTWVIGENVSGHIKLGLDSVLEDLASEGYSTRTFSISASSIGANHKRERVWTVANSNDRNHEQEKEIRTGWNTSNSSSQNVAYTYDTRDRTSQHETNSDREKINEGWQEQSFSEPSRQSEDVANSQSQWRGEPRYSYQEKRSSESSSTQPQSSSSDVADSNSKRQQEQWWPISVERQRKEGQELECKSWWESEPRVGRVAHGIPKRVDRLKTLGNAVVPHIPYYIGQAIVESYQ